MYEADEPYEGILSSEYMQEDKTTVPAGDTEGIDAVLVLDVSGSMVSSDPELCLREAALSYLEGIASRKDSRAALITFSDEIVDRTELCDISTQEGFDAFSQRLSSIQYTRGDTDIGLALSAAVRLLENAPQPRNEQIILLLTDGEIDLPKAENEAEAEEESLKLALLGTEEIRNANGTIDTVMLDPSGELNPYLCSYMADQTGGQCVKTEDASALPALFRQLSDSTVRRAEERSLASETEVMAQTETETETEIQAGDAGTLPPAEPEETESEARRGPSVKIRGTVQDPVLLKGFLPSACRAELTLSDLFALDPPPSGDAAASVFSPNPSGLIYTAYSDDAGLLTCTVEGDTLSLRGIRNGTGEVILTAQSADSYEEDSIQDPVQISFRVRVQALIPSTALLLAGAGGLLCAVLLIVLLLRARSGGGYLSGLLQWYVRTDGERIFGMPTQNTADLSAYGKKAALSLLVRDERLDRKTLSKVILTAREDALQVRSHTSRVVLSGAGLGPAPSLSLNHSCRFQVRVQTPRGPLSILLQYTAPSDIRGSEYADASEERTRMLVS